MQIYLHISEKSCNFARFYVLKNEDESQKSKDESRKQ